jgi:hypothetical protein
MLNLHQLVRVIGYEERFYCVAALSHGGVGIPVRPRGNRENTPGHLTWLWKAGIVRGDRIADGYSQEVKGDQVRMSKVKVIIAALFAVLALGALISSSASAATAGWLVNGTLLTGEQTAKLATTAAVDQNALLKFKELEIECKGTTLDATEPQIESLKNKAAVASLKFLGCSAVSGGCELEGQPVTIGTTPLGAEATLEGALGLAAALKPKSGTIFATFKFASGGTCSVAGEKLPVTGEAPAAAPTGQDERTLQLLSLNVTQASGKLKIGPAAGSLVGSALLKLASSLPWSFM